MHEKTLPRDVLELLDSCIDSVEALEVLLVLHGDPSRWWAVPELARTVTVNPDDARRAASDLHAHGLASRQAAGPLFRLAPLDQLAHAACAELSRVYRSERTAIVEHVSRRSMARLRMLAYAFTRSGSST